MCGLFRLWPGALLLGWTVGALAKSLEHTVSIPVINAATDHELRELYHRLIVSENAHDIASVRRFVWQSPNALFVAKTKTPAEGNWAGFWGLGIRDQSPWRAIQGHLRHGSGLS